MGNQLVRIAPSQISPVESYIQDLNPDDIKVQFIKSLGSTRFFKVAKCNSEAGPVVVKVFVIPPSHDVKTQDIEKHEARLRDLRDVLDPTLAPNCQAFLALLFDDGGRAGFIIRQYGKYSLYDRISTRPFLTNLEKR